MASIPVELLTHVEEFVLSDQITIQTINLETSAKMFSGTSSCPICLEVLMSSSQQLLELSCLHIFHKECILDWVEKNPNCPVCRKNLLGVP